MVVRSEPEFVVGDASVWRVEEWRGEFSPPEGLFAEYDEATFASYADQFGSEYFVNGSLYAFLQSWLIEVEGQLILVDTGAGNDKQRPGIPVFADLQTAYLDNLRSLGFEPEAIDIVICTHLHIDHVGWNTQWNGAAWVPTFPNAKYLFPAIENEVWNPVSTAYSQMRGAVVNENVYEDSVAPILAHQQATLVDDGHCVLNGLSLWTAPGHTPGHMVVDLQRGSDRALFVGDVMHHPMQILQPDWNSVYCEVPHQAVVSRKRVLALAADTGARIVPAHFGGTHSAFVERVGDGYGWIEG